MTSQPTNQNQNPQPRRQSPEDTMARIAGVPKTPEELQAEQQQLNDERTANAQRNAGVLPNLNQNQNQPVAGQPHVEQERQRSEQDQEREREAKRQHDKADH